MKIDDFDPFRTGEAIAFRVDQGHGPALDWAGVLEAIEHPTTGLNRDKLILVIGYLAAQLVGRRNSADRDAELAFAQIRSIVREHERRHDGGAA